MTFLDTVNASSTVVAAANPREKIIRLRRIIISRSSSAAIRVRSGTTAILADLQNSTGPIDLRFEAADDQPQTVRDADLVLENTGTGAVTVWVSYELVD